MIKIQFNKKLSKIIKSIFAYSIFTIMFTVISAPCILFYGPFENARRTYVGTAMGSMHYKWLATSFLSQDRIDEILGTNEDINNIENAMDMNDTKKINIASNDSSIELKQINDENNKFKGYALLVNDPKRVKIGVSSKLFTEGETVSKIAENNEAVAAINGGYFTDEEGSEKWTSNGGIPSGFLMCQGEVKQNIDPNIKTPILAITKEGKMMIGDITTERLLEKKENDKDVVVEAMSYVTTLIKNGVPANLDDSEGTAPKTMIGQKNNGTMVLVVLDSNLPGGRICANLREAQKVMMNLGCYNAVNLDGGKSTTMYFNGDIINNPSYALGERPISSGFIVK